MCRFGVVLLLLAHVVLLAAAPIREENVDLVSYENEQTDNGYRFSYETNDGLMREEVGILDEQTGVMRVSGWYSFRTPDGETFRVDFVADENGYRTTEQPSPVTKPPLVLPRVTTEIPVYSLSRTALISLAGPG